MFSSITAPPRTVRGRRRLTAAALVGACALFLGSVPAHANETTPGAEADRFNQLAPAQQRALSDEAGVNAGQLDRAQTLTRQAQAADQDFYATPANLPEANGGLVRHEKARFYLDPVKLVPLPAEATKVMYRTTDSHGQAVATTGTVLTSTSAWRKKGPRPLIVYSAGTQGMGDPCAPSRQMGVGLEYEGPALSALLKAGYHVVVPDYIGLGTPGPHTYMNRVDQAHAVLDAARAAQNLGVGGLAANTPVAAVGYSQGGGATASAAESAPSYAPELKLKAAWAGAPPADLTMTGKAIDSTLFTGLSFYVMGGAVPSGVDPASFLNAAGMQRYERAQKSCVVSTVATNALVPSTSLTQDGRSFSQHLADPALAGYLAEQKLGTGGRHPAVPVRIAHSPGDDVVPYRAGRELAQRWCGQGSNVSFQTLATPTHLGAYVEGVPSMLAFLEARFSGLPQLNSCWRL